MSTQPSPKILIVDLSKHYGGASSRVLSLMANSPGGSIALAGLESGAVVHQARQLGLPVHALAKSKSDPRILPRLVKLVRKEKIDVIDSQNIQSKFWASMAAMLTKSALVSTIHSWYTNEHGKGSMKGKAYTTLELLTNPGLDLYISVSKQDVQALRKAGLAEDAIELIYNAVRIDPQAISGNHDWLTKKFGLDTDSIVCTAVGRLVPIKGYDILIEAVKKIAADVPKLVVLIVGEGECKQELQEQIDREGLKNRVHLAGYHERESVLSIVKASDIFVMPSRYEGTPIALLEAAALGRPILSTLTGGIPELVESEEHALLVPPADPKSLSEGLVKLCKDQKYARDLGLKAQTRIQEHFSLDHQVKATWDAYRKAWGRHQASR